jgi:hypothetical protein
MKTDPAGQRRGTVARNHRPEKPTMKKKNDTLRRKLQAARRAGISREEAEKILTDGAREAAAQQGWRDSELAMTLADHARALDAVYGPKGARP